MSRLEKHIQNDILKALRGRGGWWVKFHVGPRYSTAGVPDIIGSYKGTFVGLEVKRPGHTPTVLQTATHRQMTEQGEAVVYTVHNKEEALDVLDSLDEWGRAFPTKRKGETNGVKRA